MRHTPRQRIRIQREACGRLVPSLLTHPAMRPIIGALAAILTLFSPQSGAHSLSAGVRVGF